MKRPILFLTAFLAFATVAGATEKLSFALQIEGRGPAIIFIPGLTSPGSVWDGAVASLRERYTCHVLTLAGFAGVPPVAEPSLDRVRQDIIDYIRARRLTRPIIVGHSVGGFLAYWVAATAPELVGGIVALDGAMFMPALFDPDATTDKMRPQAEGMRRGIAAASAASFAKQSNAQLASQISDPADRAKIAEAAARSDPATTGQFLHDLFTTDLRAEGRRITVPVLLLVGTRGIDPSARAAYVASARSQVSTIKLAQVVEVLRARHFIQLDAHSEFMRHLLEFLAQVKQ